MKDSLGICVIGAGRAGMIHAENFRYKVKNAHLEAVVDQSEHARNSACRELEISKSYGSYMEALQDDKIDAIVIVTPTAMHKDISVAAAKHKKHVLCEKPMAMNESECDEMIIAAEREKIKLQIAFMRRFDENYLAAKQIVENGEIGEIVMIRSNTRGPSIPQKWMYDINISNGPLGEVNSHDIDTLRWFSNCEFKELYAIGGNFRSPEAKKDYPEFYDNVVMSAKFSNGIQGMIDGAQGVMYGYDARTEILGTNGCIFIGEVKDKKLSVCTNKYGIQKPVVLSWKNLFKDAYLNEDIGFVNCILEGELPKVTGYDGKMAVKVVKAGNLSIKENRIVSI